MSNPTADNTGDDLAILTGSACRAWLIYRGPQLEAVCLLWEDTINHDWVMDMVCPEAQQSHRREFSSEAEAADWIKQTLAPFQRRIVELVRGSLPADEFMHRVAAASGGLLEPHALS